MSKANCVCIVCGLEHYKEPYRLKKLKRGVTCSKKCADLLQTVGRTRKPNYRCVVCGKEHYQRPNQIDKTKFGLTCSKECGKINRSKHTTGKGNHQYGLKGEKNDSFLGYRKISNYGYVLIYKPEHKRANHAGYVFEHLLVMENHIGRQLKYYGFKNKHNEVCHHIDRNKKNNSIENLNLMTDVEHFSLHLAEDRERSLKAGRTRSKFTLLEAELISKEYVTGGITYLELAKKYKCSQSLIANIVNKKRYCYGKQM